MMNPTKCCSLNRDLEPIIEWHFIIASQMQSTKSMNYEPYGIKSTVNHQSHNNSVNHLRDSICQREFKVLTFEWMSLIKIDEAVQAVKSNLINKVVLGLSIFLFGFDPTVLHSSFSPEF